MALPENYQERFLAALKKRGASTACEICENNDWAIVDQAISMQITDLSGGVRIPAPQIPCGALVCNNCGNVRTFALGVLGLLSETEG